MNKRTHWLVLYDIRNSKRLNKVAKLLCSFGVRVQKSVFELNCTEKDIEHLRAMLRYVIKEEDYILFFSVCERDWQKKETYGKNSPGKTIMDEPFIII